MKNCRIMVTVFATVVLWVNAALATGNGAPSGPHYNLNIIGVSKDKTAEMTGTSGHTIFVPLWGKANIWLCNSSNPTSECYGLEFAVLDRNGTDNNGATFALPAPDPDNNGTTDYSVFARALGNPEGYSLTRTCLVEDPGADGIVGTADDVLECSELILTLDASERPQKFQNVSKYLLYVYADIDDDGDLERVPLFGDGFEDFFWEYDNHGLRLAQLRFYPCSSTVPSATDPNGITTDNCGRTGN